MHDLSDIPDLDDGAIELLEAAGYMDLRGLARSEAADVFAELQRANEMLRIADETPARGQVDAWVERARELSGEDPAGWDETAERDGDESSGRAKLVHKQAPEDDRLVNYEADPVVVEMLDNAPFAIPVPVELMARNEVTVGDVASGTLLTRVSGDLEIRVDTRPSKRQEETEEQAAVGPAGLVKRGIDTSRIRSIDQLREDRSNVRMTSLPRRDAKLDELRTASAEINLGKDPSSRWYIRGLLHPNPFKLRAAAMITVACQLLMPLAVVASVLLLLAAIDPERFPWVGSWLLLFPLALPICGVLYMVNALGMRCRVCTQRLFLPRRCLRNPKAHHVAGLGYIFPLCVHLLIFSWFRCEYCGTATRLKK